MKLKELLGAELDYISYRGVRLTDCDLRIEQKVFGGTKVTLRIGGTDVIPAGLVIHLKTKDGGDDRMK